MYILKHKFLKVKIKINKMDDSSNKSFSSEYAFKYNQKMKLLVDNLKNESYITKKEVYNAMLQTDRGDYIDPIWAYKDWYDIKRYL